MKRQKNFLTMVSLVVIFVFTFMARSAQADSLDLIFGGIKMLTGNKEARETSDKTAEKKESAEAMELWKNFTFKKFEVDVYKQSENIAFFYAKDIRTKKTVSGLKATKDDMDGVNKAMNGGKAEGEKFIMWLFANIADPKIQLQLPAEQTADKTISAVDPNTMDQK